MTERQEEEMFQTPTRHIFNSCVCSATGNLAARDDLPREDASKPVIKICETIKGTRAMCVTKTPVVTAKS